MISFIKGTLVSTDEEGAVIEVNGIGYRVSMSLISISKLGTVGAQVQVLTYMYVREDALVLYGFFDAEERELFERLITISGVGPKVALSALSRFEPQELIGAIVAQDVAAVQKIPGVGKKTAQRIVLELKDALAQSAAGPLFAPAQPDAQSISAATDALLSMGFTSAEAELALKGAPEDANDSELLRYALKRLGE